MGTMCKSEREEFGPQALPPPQFLQLEIPQKGNIPSGYRSSENANQHQKHPSIINGRI
uniref:Uncharacterized protein n=1 Tax=Rhizophora mucronata TaxID=61149 RepID=A0A2P2QNM8_RHIMU